MFNNIHALTEMMIKDYVSPGFTVVDATVGNGKDAKRLLTALENNGFLYGFDIQPEAISVANAYLNEAGFSQFKLIQDGHEHMDQYIDQSSVDFIMFNLGYLPKGDKSITTKIDTSMRAIMVGLDLLKVNGFMLVASYPGHDAGREEYHGLQEKLSTLDQKVYNVFHGQFINQKNHPPALFIIERIK